MINLPKNWEIRFSKTTGKTFYFNSATNVTQWNHPSIPQSVKCSHIIIKSRESRKPYNLRDQPVTISRQEAMNKILDIRNKIVSGQEKFEDMAYRYSDCSSGVNKRGDLGIVLPNQLQWEFEEAVFAMDVGEISGPVWTASGVHIIKRTA